MIITLRIGPTYTINYLFYYYVALKRSRDRRRIEGAEGGGTTDPDLVELFANYIVLSCCRSTKREAPGETHFTVFTNIV